MARSKTTTKQRTPSVRNYDYITCRTFGHAWQPGATMRRPPWGVYVVLDCTRCNMQRRDIVNLKGDVSSRQYVQPDDYRLPNVKRQRFRAEFVRRAVGNKR